MGKDELKQKVRDKDKSAKRKRRFSYSFLTIVLLISLVQIGRGAIDNVAKSIVNAEKIREIKTLKINAYNENVRLKQEMEDIGTLKSMEEIARNNLKMAGKDEVLVIVSKDEKEVPEKKKKPSDRN